jgi:hypothetical protein
LYGDGSFYTATKEQAGDATNEGGNGEPLSSMKLINFWQITQVAIEVRATSVSRI